MLESPSSSVGSLDPASPRMRAGTDNNGGFYVTMTPLNSNSKVSVSFPRSNLNNATAILIFIHNHTH